jgi:hypothetical protein
MISPSKKFFKELESHAPAIAFLEEIVVYIHEDCTKRRYSVGPYESEERRSSISWDHNSGCGVIHIDPRASSEFHPVDAVWDLLHEWGHAMDNPPAFGYKPGKNEFTYQREYFAWSYAWHQASSRYPYLLGCEFDYRRRQEMCLSSFRP